MYIVKYLPAMNFSLRTTWLCAAEAWRRRRHIAAVFTSKSHQQQNFYWSRPDALRCSGRAKGIGKNELSLSRSAAACRVLTCVKSHHAWGGLFPSAESDPAIASFFLLTRIEGHFSISHSASKLEATASGWNLFLRRAHDILYYIELMRCDDFRDIFLSPGVDMTRHKSHFFLARHSHVLSSIIYSLLCIGGRARCPHSQGLASLIFYNKNYQARNIHIIYITPDGAHMNTNEEACASHAAPHILLHPTPLQKVSHNQM